MENEKCINISWLLVRVTLGLTLLWAFFDKALGLGFKTCSTIDATTKVKTVEYMCEKAWFFGGSPTKGFLMNASGPLGSVFKALSSSTLIVGIINVLFMIGLLGIGLALIFGFMQMLAGYSGALLMLLMYFAAFVPENNPLIDEHLVYAAVFLLMAAIRTAGDNYGFGRWWKSQAFVQKYKWLE